jgi:hypothetical protein
LILTFAVAALALTACDKGKEAGDNHIVRAEIATCSGTVQQCTQAMAKSRGAVQIVTSSTVRGLKLHLPAPTVTATARTATVALPFRISDNLTWNLEPGVLSPWRLKSTHMTPGGGPQGTDLATFEFEATAPGSTTLMFNLTSAPEGGGDRVKSYQATVRAQ